MQRILQIEIFRALGLLRSNIFAENPTILQWLCRKLEGLFDLPTLRFAELGTVFDQTVARGGFAEAARSILPRFVRQVHVLGGEAVPDSGPLLIASNHPGAYDSLVLAAQVPHPRLKIVVGDISFLSHLPWASQHMIFVLHTEVQLFSKVELL